MLSTSFAPAHSLEDGSSTCAIISEVRGVGVLRPRKTIRVLWQKLSSCVKKHIRDNI